MNVGDTSESGSRADEGAALLSVLGRRLVLEGSGRPHEAPGPSLFGLSALHTAARLGSPNSLLGSRGRAPWRAAPRGAF